MTTREGTRDNVSLSNLCIYIYAQKKVNVEASTDLVLLAAENEAVALCVHLNKNLSCTTISIYIYTYV